MGFLGFGNRSEMKNIKERSESVGGRIHHSLENLKEELLNILATSKETIKPERNMINLKQDLLLETKESLKLLRQIEAKIDLDMAYKNIAKELILDDIQLNFSEIENEIYRLKEIKIPTTQDLQEFFEEYSSNYNETISKSGMAIGALAIGGGAVGAGVTSVGLGMALSSSAIVGAVGTSIMGIGGLVSGAAAILTGPVGWIAGGIGLLGWLGSAPTDEEIMEAREKLSELQRAEAQITDQLYSARKMTTKIKAVLRLTDNFFEMKEVLEIGLEKKVSEIIEDGTKNLEENKIKLIELRKFEYNIILNKAIDDIYIKNKYRKKLFCFKRKATVHNIIESTTSMEDAIKYILKYLSLSREEKNILKKLYLIIENYKNIDIISTVKNQYFNFSDSYKLLEEHLKNDVDSNVKIDSPKVINNLKKLVTMVKLIKNILETPMLNITKDSMEYEDEIINIATESLEYYGEEVIHDEYNKRITLKYPHLSNKNNNIFSSGGN